MCAHGGKKNDRKIYNYMVKLQIEVVLNWFYVNVRTCSCHVLNSTWSAECAEFACIVIELVIGSYCPLQTFNVFCVSLTNYSSCFEGKLLLLITVFKHYNYYIVITFGFSITTTWIITTC